MSTGFDVNDDRISLTIPWPAYIPRSRGIHAKGKFGTLFKAKCSVDEKELVDQAARHVGISHSEFVRYVCMHAAKEVLKNVRTEEPEQTG